jgi:hypothetical protein
VHNGTYTMTALILYTTEDGSRQIKLRAKDQTVWLSQREMAQLFDVSTDNVGLHLKNVFEDGELSREATTEESSVVQTEGGWEVQRPVTLYNLDAILAVGYRVRSKRGVQFRRWAATILEAYGRRLLPQMGLALSAKFGRGVWRPTCDTCGRFTKRFQFATHCVAN